eukprot:scaffold1705_cov304-Prasinococcus_capsulatus_cf.AAC.4
MPPSIRAKALRHAPRCCACCAAPALMGLDAASPIVRPPLPLPLALAPPPLPLLPLALALALALLLLLLLLEKEPARERRPDGAAVAAVVAVAQVDDEAARLHPLRRQGGGVGDEQRHGEVLAVARGADERAQRPHAPPPPVHRQVVAVHERRLGQHQRVRPPPRPLGGEAAAVLVLVLVLAWVEAGEGARAAQRGGVRGAEVEAVHQQVVVHHPRQRRRARRPRRGVRRKVVVFVVNVGFVVVVVVVVVVVTAAAILLLLLLLLRRCVVVVLVVVLRRAPREALVERAAARAAQAQHGAALRLLIGAQLRARGHLPQPWRRDGGGVRPREGDRVHARALQVQRQHARQQMRSPASSSRTGRERRRRRQDREDGSRAGHACDQRAGGRRASIRRARAHAVAAAACCSYRKELSSTTTLRRASPAPSCAARSCRCSAAVSVARGGSSASQWQPAAQSSTASRCRSGGAHRPRRSPRGGDARAIVVVVSLAAGRPRRWPRARASPLYPSVLEAMPHPRPWMQTQVVRMWPARGRALVRALDAPSHGRHHLEWSRARNPIPRGRTPALARLGAHATWARPSASG